MRTTKLTALLIAATLLGAGTLGAAPAFASHSETVFFEAPRDLLGVPAATQAKTLAKLRRPESAQLLRDYLDEHLLALDWTDGLVFGASAASPFSPSPLRERAATAWDSAGLTLHECRHTFASLMIAAGVNAKALSTYMGHANISITLDRYGHLMPGNEEHAAALLDAFLARATDESARASLAPVVS